MKVEFKSLNFVKTILLIFIVGIFSYIICNYFFDNPFLNQTLFAIIIILTNMKMLKMEIWKAIIFYISIINIIFFLSIFISIPVHKIFKNLSSYIIIIIPIIMTILATNRIIKINKKGSIIFAIILSPFVLILTDYSKSLFVGLKDPWTFFFWTQIILGIILSLGININILKKEKIGCS